MQSWGLGFMGRLQRVLRVRYGQDAPARRQEQSDPRDPGGVAACMSARSKTPYITPSMEFSSAEGRGGAGSQGAAADIYLAAPPQPPHVPRPPQYCKGMAAAVLFLWQMPMLWVV